MTHHAIASAVLLVLLAACSRDAAAPQAEPAASPQAQQAAAPAPADALETPPPLPEAAPAPAPEDDAPSFAGKVWRVVESGGVEPGTTYAFLADGTLVIQGPAGDPPGYGKWRYEDGALTIEEEGIAYPTDILRADDARLELRSHNPGGTLDIRLEPAPEVALPEVQ